MNDYLGRVVVPKQNEHFRVVRPEGVGHICWYKLDVWVALHLLLYDVRDWKWIFSRDTHQQCDSPLIFVLPESMHDLDLDLGSNIRVKFIPVSVSLSTTRRAPALSLLSSRASYNVTITSTL